MVTARVLRAQLKISIAKKHRIADLPRETQVFLLTEYFIHFYFVTGGRLGRHKILDTRKAGRDQKSLRTPALNDST